MPNFGYGVLAMPITALGWNNTVSNGTALTLALNDALVAEDIESFKPSGTSPIKTLEPAVKLAL